MVKWKYTQQVTIYVSVQCYALAELEVHYMPKFEMNDKGYLQKP